MAKTASSKPSKSDASIIPEKYRDKYKEPDAIGELINSQCVTVEGAKEEKKDKDGKVTQRAKKGKSTLNVDKLFKLAKINGVDVGKYKDQVDRPNAPGRLRMTVGNMLRARAKRRGGLYDLEKNPVKMFADLTPTETLDGEKIAAKTDKAKEDA